MRPRGDIRHALLKAAEAGPGNVRELAHRAQVGMQAAYYTTSRMVSDGELMVLSPGKPALLGRAESPPADSPLVLSTRAPAPPPAPAPTAAERRAIAEQRMASWCALLMGEGAPRM